jgi:nitrous oxide reductase accessory protein NosL
MTGITKNIIIDELRDIPDEFASEILDFIKFLKIQKNPEKIQTHFASEASLAKDWLKPEEDEAWKDL